MVLKKLFRPLVETVSRLGLSHSYFLDELNGIIKLGQFLRKNRPYKSFKGRYELYEYLNSEVIKNRCIDYLEFGVYEGNSIAKWAEINTDIHSRFFGFDSFEGLPEKYKYTFSKTLQAGVFSTDGKIPAIDDDRVHFVKGYFHDTVPDFSTTFEKKADYLVINFDADLYTATLFVLMSLNDLIVPRTLIIFDEFFSVNHEFRAFTDYTASFGKKYRLLAATKFYEEVAIEIS